MRAVKPVLYRQVSCRPLQSWVIAVMQPGRHPVAAGSGNQAGSSIKTHSGSPLSKIKLTCNCEFINKPVESFFI